MTKMHIVKVTDAEFAALERARADLRLRSRIAVVRYWIERHDARPAPPLAPKRRGPK